ncbi:hypothetical protein HYZ05_02110 [Candidatus Daviesbacteria bacterium]|nr:hypothetical protein [Candidatus Daviesbacteria bacterium]
MNQETLNIFLLLALFVVTTCIVFATFYFVGALKSITQLADDLDETTQSLKNKVQLKALTAIPALLVALAGKVIRKKRG